MYSNPNSLLLAQDSEKILLHSSCFHHWEQPSPFVEAEAEGKVDISWGDNKVTSSFLLLSEEAEAETTYKMLSLAFDWTISFSWLMWPRETEMFSLSSRQSRYWVLLPLHQVTTHLPSCELTYLTKHGYLLLPCFIHASSMLRCQVNYLGPCIRFPGAATQWSVEVCLRLQLNGPILLCICKCDHPFNYPLELN